MREMSLNNFMFCVSRSGSIKFIQNLPLYNTLKRRFATKCKESANTTIPQISDNSKFDKFQPFLDMVTNRRAEARRSIVVQVQSAQSAKELHSYCSFFGSVQKMLHYTSGGNQMHFIIVEYSKEASVDDILCNSSHVGGQGIPIYSNFLWFRASKKKPKLKQSNTAKLDAENGNHIISDKEVKEIIQQYEIVSDQILALYNATALNEVSTRLRFLTARQIEMCVASMFPKVVAYPFGSSVNGFGRMGCDLDLVLKLNADEKISDDSRLVFHCKANGHERSISQRHMEMFGDLIQLFLPGCTQVRKILQARVPIIKYYQQLTDVECDLSMSNMSGVYMSDLLHIFGSVDPRVRPLVFSVRKWAQEVGLTNSSPGRWISNFSLSLLVLAFLQNPGTSPPVLPTLNTLVKYAGDNDKYITEEGVNCTFLRDITRLPFKTKNTDSLESLFKQFCEFYCLFDFSTQAVCLNEAISITKPEHSPLYIVNPLERGLNVSKNVSLDELEKFKYELRNAAWTLETQEKKMGILEVFESKKRLSHSLAQKQGRMMDVSRLFEEENESEKVEGNKRTRQKSKR